MKQWLDVVALKTQCTISLFLPSAAETAWPVFTIMGTLLNFNYPQSFGTSLRHQLNSRDAYEQFAELWVTWNDRCFCSMAPGNSTVCAHPLLGRAVIRLRVDGQMEKCVDWRICGRPGRRVIGCTYEEMGGWRDTHSEGPNVQIGGGRADGPL
jgi:hypothetical protein